MELGIVKPIGIVDQMTGAYLDYSMSVIVSRALPDVRDGLKPVHRRVLYAMDQMGLQANRSFRKSAGVVGEVLKEYHPHSDASVYDTLVRLVQPWAMRYPLALGQGNWGCFTGDTKISLLDGSVKTFAELAQLPANEVFYVYSVDAKGNIVVGKGRNARVTRKSAALVEVALDSGAKIRCTPDHRFMLRDGTYKEAHSLTPEDSLMPHMSGASLLPAALFKKSASSVTTLEKIETAPRTTVGVASVQYINERKDVYDITVDEHHNFLLADGVFVHNSVDDDPAAAMRYCVTGDTLVVTDTGLVPIGQLSQPGVEDMSARVLSQDGDINTASKWWDCGAFPTWRVRTHRGYEVTGTENHPLLVAAPGETDGRTAFVWKTISQLKPGDYLVLDRSDVFWPEQYVDVQTLHPQVAEQFASEAHPLPAKLNQDLAFIMGSLLAEGTFGKQKIEFTNTEGEYADTFIETWRRVFPTCRLHIFKRDPVGYGKKPFLQIQIVSYRVRDFLRALGLSGRSAERRLPALILRSPKEVAAAFLRGLFEGDGAVERSGSSLLRVSLHARNRAMLQQAQTLLLRFGIASALRWNATKQMHRLCITGHGDLALFEEKVGFASATKRMALETALALYGGKALSKTDFVPFLGEYVREHALRGQREWLSKHDFDRADRLEASLPRLALALPTADYAQVEQIARRRHLFDQIEAIEEASVQPVYSVRVDSECHSFVANGFINHNTETKMSVIAAELLADIDKDTVDFKENYDGHSTEPVVLPARLPNLLLNGSAGIAVGMATNIPPHNLREVCDGITHLIDHPDATTEDLMRIIRGPDFPTGGIIQGREGIRGAYTAGRGRIIVRAKAHVEETERGKNSIIVTELPYQVNKAELVRKISELARDKKIDGITDVRDESDRQGMRVVIDLRRDARNLSVLNQLFKFTAMQTTFGANMLALVDGQPRTLTLKQIVQHYITYRESVITRRTRFDLAKAQARQHILEGLTTALDNLDAVIETIRRSQNRETAGNNLRTRFKLSEEQAKAILDMQLGRLAALERRKIIDELAEVKKIITDLQRILANISEVRSLIKQDMVELKEKYGDPRRTEIVETEATDFSEEDLIPNDEIVVMLTQGGYIKRINSTAYRAQRRGGRGSRGITTHEDDTVLHLLSARAHDALLFFTNRGRVFQLKAYGLPDVGRAARGEHLRNLIGIDQEESVTAVVRVPKFVARDYMVLATRRGEVKKTSLDDFASVRSLGLIAMDLEPGDELIGARLTQTDDTVMLISERGQAIRFSVQDLRAASRMSGGVRGIRLDEDDALVSLVVPSKDSELLVVTTNGYGKRTPVDEYPTHGRGGGGIITARLTDKTGVVAAARILTEEDRDLMIVSAEGTVIRTDWHTVAQSGRPTQGVRLMNMSPKDRVVSIATLYGEVEEDDGLTVVAAEAEDEDE